MPVYIEKINGDANQPTDRQGEYRAICLFEIWDIRKKAEICNSEENDEADTFLQEFLQFCFLSFDLPLDLLRGLLHLITMITCIG